MKAECPQHFDVRLMDLDEKESLIQQLLAEKDAREAQGAADADENEHEHEEDEDFA